uniref:Uncharacterized protein n=1 Tax=Romanomermis culicivorax TaxID=13658 RepID=A0A915HFR1_ROMCU
MGIVGNDENDNAGDSDSSKSEAEKAKKPKNKKKKRKIKVVKSSENVEKLDALTSICDIVKSSNGTDLNLLAEKNLFTIEYRNLNMENELKRIFGGVVGRQLRPAATTTRRTTAVGGRLVRTKLDARIAKTGKNTAENIANKDEKNEK